MRVIKIMKPIEVKLRVGILIAILVAGCATSENFTVTTEASAPSLTNQKTHEDEDKFKAPNLKFLTALNEEGKVSETWLEAIKDRNSEVELKQVAQQRRLFSKNEMDWLSIIQDEAVKWRRSTGPLEDPFSFSEISPPTEITILFGHGNGADSFTFEEHTICFDLSEWEKAYGNAQTSENIGRIHRILSHEYTHLLTKAWANKHPPNLGSPLDRALWELFYEGLGNYWSLSEKWLPKNGRLPSLSEKTLASNIPVLVERLVHLSEKNLSLEEEKIFRMGLSSGRFSEKWGATTISLWLAQEVAKDRNSLARFVRGGVSSVYDLLGKYLSKEDQLKVSTSLPPQFVSFQNDKLELKGVLYKPLGIGPFPALLYNHGSAPGMLNAQAADLLGPLFIKHGWIFFMPYRRGQGLSQNAGPYIMDEVTSAEKKGGRKAAAVRMNELLKTDHLSDQLAAIAWLKKQPEVNLKQIAAGGNSFGGILTVLAAEKESFCAAIDAAGAAQSWSESRSIQNLMIDAVKNSKAPIYFFQAENDFDLSPSRVLSEAMKVVGKPFKFKIYPPYGNSSQEGHSFAYRGSRLWEKEVFEFLNSNCRVDM